MKSRVALALALLTALMAPAAAAVTTKYTLSNASWTDLGAGPMLLGFSGTGVYAIADTTPSIPKSEGFTMIAGESAQVATSSHVWAMAKDSPGVLAYVGPYDAPSGTSSGGGVVQQGAVDATAAPWQIDTLATGNLINAIKGPVTLGSASGGLTPKLLNALTNVGVAVKATAGHLYMVQCWNPNATVAYLQVYDAATITGTPKLSFGIAPTSTGGMAVSMVGIQFATAIEVQGATTATGSTALTTAMDCNALYF